MILNLGVDFGTSTTKVFCRNLAARRDQQLEVVWFGVDGQKASMPSTLRIKDGLVWFGDRAEAHTGGQVFRSLKICVACAEGAIACRCCADGCATVTRGCLAVQTAEGSDLVSARELCTILVAGLLNEASMVAQQRIPADAIPELVINVAAPLDQVAHDPLGAVFQEVLGHATALRGKIVNGMMWKAARWQYRSVAAQPLPSHENRRFNFFPEAIAAIHAYYESPAADEGLYALVDVGAGTTAVSFLRLANRDLEKRIVFYASHTEIVGADDMDLALAAALRVKYPAAPAKGFDSRSFVRSAKEVSPDGGISVGDYLLSSGEAATALRPVFDRIFDVYQRTARTAYCKEPYSSCWEKLTVVLVGGGSLVAGLSTRLLAPPQAFIRNRRIQQLTLPADVASPEGALPVTLLAVGFGLSFVATDIPDYWAPADVEPVGSRPTGRKPGKDSWGEDQV